MKKILIYGDSNVWGDNFLVGKRIPEEKQWPNILQSQIVKYYKIIQEGLPGRLAGNEEQEKKYKNGKDTFLAIFRTSAPVDKIIIMLGTNDLQKKYNRNAQEIIEDLKWYKNILKEEFSEEDNQMKYFANGKFPEIIYILPIPFDYKENAKEIFNKKSEEERQKICNYFKNEAEIYIDIPEISLFKDGIHLDYEGHKQIAAKVKEFIYEK